jgi:flagellin-like protein
MFGTDGGSDADDSGVSAVIGVILMVAITVAIAATVYIWVGGFGTESGGDETASATAKSATENSTKDWVRVTLASGENAPYAYSSEVSVEFVKADGTVISNACADMTNSGNADCSNNTFSGDWTVGTSMFLPCSGEGDHQVTVAVLDTTILDRTVQCQNEASFS